MHISQRSPLYSRIRGGQSTFIFLSVKLNAALLTSCRPSGDASAKLAKVTQHVCARANASPRPGLHHPTCCGRTSPSETCSLATVEWRLPNKMIPGTLMEHWWERENVKGRAASCLCHLRYVRSSSGARGSSRLRVCCLFLVLHNGAGAFSLHSAGGGRSATLSQRTLCEKTPVIYSFIHLYISLFILLILFTSFIWEVPNMQRRPRGIVLLFISPNKNEAPRSIFLELRLQTDSLL